MNVTGPFTYCIANQIINEFNNRRLACHFFEVFKIPLLLLNHLHVRHITDDVVKLVITLLFTEGIAGLAYIFVQAYDNLNVHPSLSFGIFDDKEVGGSACRHNQGFAL